MEKQFFLGAHPVKNCLPQILISLPQIFICLPQIFLSLPQIFLSLPQIFLSLPIVFLSLPIVFLSLPLSHSSSLRLFDSPKKDPHVRCISAATKPFPLGRGWGRPRLLVSLTLSSHVGFSAGFMQGLCRIFASNPTQYNVRRISEIRRKYRVLCRVCRVFLFPYIYV